MNVLIIEDEARAAVRLERLIAKVAPDFSVIAKTESVQESIGILKDNTDIQLIFSDIELGDGTSFEIFQKLESNIPIIFTTAYNQYAIEAFKVNGVDYLLKPIDEKELQTAIQKFQLNFQKDNSYSNADAIALAIQSLQPAPAYKNRFLVKVGGKLKSIPTAEIAAFYSMAKGTFLFTKSKRNYSIDQPLEQIIQILNPDQFFKISRKYIVALDSLNEILVHSNSRLILKIAGMETQEIVVARERVKEFKAWLG